MVAKFDSRSKLCIEEVPNKKEDSKRSGVKTPLYIILSAMVGLLVGFTIAFVLFGNNHSIEHLQNFEDKKNLTEITGK